ncbi:phospholipid:diacylglycerol acyltransferase [Cerrena zonata]|uniref:Phospholipid:diacylglycerol acyltransferase n=1 Tax=Cerrena zonata TaxID=2478898 RepID=A0AAW0FPL8_9APHY
MSHEWKKPNSRFNPANINVTIVEIKHEPDRYDIRGGAKTAEHVDILGSSELNELILRVAGGQGDRIPDRYPEFN